MKERKKSCFLVNFHIGKENEKKLPFIVPFFFLSFFCVSYSHQSVGVSGDFAVFEDDLDDLFVRLRIDNRHREISNKKKMNH